MIPAVALRCPNCKRQLEVHSWSDDSSGQCRFCGTNFEFMAFPALTAGPARIAPQAAEVAADSVCFFHAQNRADSVCDECGRLLCPVCTVPFMGQKLCPVCIATAAKKQSAQVAVRGRVLHDNIALALVVLPVATFFFFVLTIVTAPLALGWVIYAWNKPSSLVGGRRRWRLVLAALFAVAEIVGWVYFFIFLNHRGVRH